MFEPSQPPGTFSGVIEVDTSSTLIALPHRYIDPATLVVEHPDSTHIYRAGIDFKLQPTFGRLTWLSPPPPPRLDVRFRYLPVSLPDTLQERTLADARAADSLLDETIRVIPRRREQTRGGLFGSSSDLRTSGSITRGVRVGSNRDVSLESGVRLGLEGQLARDIEVKALLDDRNLPVQPEGTSRRLEEIDQVYIDLKAGRNRGRFGDYRVDFTNGRY
ncbi:hypothetical protein GF324_04980, partial [bacterium]|nr:hypothetical protein [bacterium]